jgi:dienelactone hydrolase
MQSETIEYAYDNLVMQGFMARKPSTKPQPLIMVLHDWSGCRELAHERAKYFAHQGYVGFAVDLYGKGKLGSDTDTSLNLKLMNEVLHDRRSIVSRLQAALDRALKLDNVNPQKIVMIGFCFGGLCAVISVHGLFVKPDYPLTQKIQAKVLALHGYLDKSVTPDKLAAFQEEMHAAGAEWQVHTFGNAMHAFTNPRANDPTLGLKYDPNADAMTWLIVKAYIDTLA